jgi:hypothetical protein
MNNNKYTFDEGDLRPSASRLIESLRDTGYSKEAAFADIIDNSISANATKVRIELTELYGDIRVIITDNGDGMDEALLVSAMRYGSPKREDPKSLGKFGMGLKTASTAFCKRLTVITNDGVDLSLRAWDLETIQKTDLWTLEAPAKETYIDDIDELNDFIIDKPTPSGTTIIWEKVDRLINLSGTESTRSQLKHLSEDLIEELSAIFSNFIKENLSISLKFLDSPELFLKPWDPLCRDLIETANGSKPRIIPSKKVSVDLVGGQKTSFSITGGLIPSINDLTPEEQDQVRYNLDNQGIYIYREGRLIWHDGWPNRMYKKESKMTRLRVELNFTHELDEVFNIDFRKSRVIIPPQVRKLLKTIIAPWRNELGRKEINVASKDTSINHDPATNAINKHKKETQSASFIIDGDDVKIKNRHERNPKSMENVHVYPELNVRVQEEEALQGNLLWEAALDSDGYTCVRLGRSHPYFSRLYATLKSNTEAQKALDMLLWSFANAEFCEYSDSNKIILRNFRQSVSMTLDHLSLELPELDSEE